MAVVGASVIRPVIAQDKRRRPARTKKKSKAEKYRKWKNGLLLSIPYYDPFEDAGDCWFDEGAAINVMDFFPKMLCHLEGPKVGKSFHLARWEQAILANLFGWKKPNGMRPKMFGCQSMAGKWT